MFDVCIPLTLAIGPSIGEVTSSDVTHVKTASQPLVTQRADHANGHAPLAVRYVQVMPVLYRLKGTN